MKLFSLKPYYGKRICVAISGGRDSVALLHALCAERENFFLSAVTCEHGIRGESSLADEKFVVSLCEKWNVPLFRFSADVPELAKASGRGVEEEGREFRYACFEKLVVENKVDFIATAHHRGDVAETILFRLLRGTSLKGMSAIEERANIIRPMLDVSRKEIDEYILENTLPFVEDETNVDEKYDRNFLRSELKKLTERFPSAEENLVRFAQRASEDDGYLQAEAEKLLQIEEGEVRLSASAPTPVLSRAIVSAMRFLGVERDYTSAHVEAVLSLKNGQTGKRVHLLSGVVAYFEHGDFIFLRPEKSEEGENDLEIPFQTGETVFGDYILTVDKDGADGQRIDEDKLPEGCVFRTRREGDIFKAYGAPEKTLKKFLTDRKISARVSHALPVLANGNRIYAVFGVEISDEVKITERTERILNLSLRKK